MELSSSENAIAIEQALLFEQILEISFDDITSRYYL
jgi:hypothetical protein